MGINDINTNNHYIPIQYNYIIYMIFLIDATMGAGDSTDAAVLRGPLPWTTIATADELDAKEHVIHGYHITLSPIR